jgi:hypothetical protein
LSATEKGKDLADWGCDVGARKSHGRNLVEERAGPVVILTVDDDNVGWRACEALGGGEAC